jgi:hypothetical protein
MATQVQVKITKVYCRNPEDAFPDANEDEFGVIVLKSGTIR